MKMSASCLPGTDKSDVDMAENTPETHGAYVLGGGREGRYMSKTIYQLINAMRNNKAEKM